ncbi:MAG: hypothetical protein M3541_16940 [Acidobacteriota bacterium]|nr:hypothetical protein [Acidobacteriota bacterium]MDQ3420432.1 hypothetical protein [Acidobacteriota bacterium]
MNKQIVTETPRRELWHHLAAEGAALEILGLEDRVREVEAERESYRTMVQSALDALRHTINERDKLRALIDHWIFEDRKSRQRMSQVSKREGSRAA